MNDKDNLEADLRRLGASLRPADDFVDRVMQQINPPRSHSRWWIVPLAAAASVAVVLGGMAWRSRSEPQPTGSTNLEYVGSTSEWQTSTRAVLLDGQTPAREISRQRFECVQWNDPRGKATYQRVVPREKCTFVTVDNY